VNVQDLTNAIIGGLQAGGEQFLEGTLAAALPVVWLFVLALHLARPYMVQLIGKFTLRLGADLLWLVYVAARDVALIAAVALSFMFFFPDVVVTDALPLTGGLAAACAFAVLVIKLVADPDDNPRLFDLTSVILALGAVLYFIPYILGVQANNIGLTGAWNTVSQFLVTNTNPVWAVGIGYGAIGIISVLGAVAAYYSTRIAAHPVADAEA
jgi:hypothetical protein